MPAGIDREALYAALVRTKARVEPGLTVSELEALEERFAFEFPPDLWMMLSLALPLDSDHSHGWTDWRHASDEVLQEALAWPVDGLVGHVKHGLWWPTWGPRPKALSEAVKVARTALAAVPQLVPVRSYHYICSEPSEPGNAVLLCHETDVFVCSRNLMDFLDDGCSRGLSPKQRAEAGHIPFWSDFAGRDPA
jgi:hypothetical protein